MNNERAELIRRLEQASHRTGELFARHQGKGWPEAASQEFTRLRDETIPELRAALLAADAQAGGEAAAHLDAMLTNILNRRVAVEQELFDMAAGKKPMPDAAKLRELALRLGDPAHTHPHPHLQPERVPLTDEQLHQMRVDSKASKEVCNEHWFILFARAIEAAHHIGKPAPVGQLEDCHGLVAGKETS